LQVTSLIGGIWRRILRVDLSHGTTRTEELPEDVFRRFLGGDGLAGKIIYDEVRPDVQPFDPENRVVFAVGPFQGTGIPGEAKFCISAKSPLTATYGNSMGGARFGPTFKKTGYDGLIVHGKAGAPVYLWIHDDGAEIRDASHLWGMDTYETVDAVRRDVGENQASVATIGPAGERRVAMACVVMDGHSFAGRCGIGAVMGSKHLKSVVAYGTKTPPIADAEETSRLTKELAKKLSDLGKGFRENGTPDGLLLYHKYGDMPIKNWLGDVWESGATKLGQPAYNETLHATSIPCLHCPVGCHRYVKIEEPAKYACDGPGPEYETLAMLGAVNLVDDLKAVAKANDYCNRLGIDTISAGAAIGFSIECYERGLINSRTTNGLALEWGDGDLVIELVRQIGLNEGFGALLAQGSFAAAQQIGRGAEDLVVHVRGLDFPAHDPRACWSLVSNYATGTRGACHLKGIPEDIECGVFTLPELGYPKQTQFFKADDKADLAAKLQDFTTLMNSLVLCIFMPDGAGMTLTDTLSCFNAVTGLHWSLAQLLQVGERGFLVQRLINTRDGKGPAYDKMPKRMSEPAKQGFRKEAVPPADALIKDYYRTRGWDERGNPLPHKLKELDI
jgi:aldehyde:ferredoxin oxidoreductase